MESKLYYTDPLKAAWMAREFGVKFRMIMDKWGDDDIEWSNTLTKWKDIAAYYEDNYTYYVHPDSYSIFEPAEGDLLTPKDGEAVYTYCGDKGIFNANIIQRNNTAFFMPEVENESR